MSEDKCPVDHKSRQAWLDKAKEANAANQASTPPPPPTISPLSPPHTTHPNTTPRVPTRWSLDTGRQVPLHTTPSSSHSHKPAFKIKGLGTDREISTIPRAQTILEDGRHAASSTHAPANHEQDTGSDAKTGNWIYPSEHMFFQAMKRKNFDPKTEDMKSIVPIHNAVNERAWEEIKQWEAGRGSEA